MRSASQRLLIGTAWLASVAIACFAGQWLLGRDASSPGAPVAWEAGRALMAPSPSAAAQNGTLADEPETSADLPALIAQAQAALGQGSQPSRMLNAFGPLLKLSEEQISAALAEVNRTVRGKMQRATFYSVLLGRWAAKDPSAALAYADANLGFPFGRDMDLRASILGAWARRDPRGALQWFDALSASSPHDRGLALQAIFEGLTGTDPDLAFARLEELDNESCSSAYLGVASSITNSTAARRLADRVTGWPEGRRRNFRAALGSVWAKIDPEAAAPLFQGLAAKDLSFALQCYGVLDERGQTFAAKGLAEFTTDDDSRRQLLEQVAAPPLAMIRSAVARPWLMDDTEAALQWMRTLPPAEARGLLDNAGSWLMGIQPEQGIALRMEVGMSENSMRYAIVDWAYQNLETAGAWLGRQPPDPLFESAHREYAITLGRVDPSAGMKWADHIQSAEERERAKHKIYNIWRTKDRAAADAALEQSGLPEEKIREIRDKK